MTKRIFFEIYFQKQIKTTKEITDLFVGIKYFIPTKMKGSGMTSGSYQKFNDKKFIECLRNDLEKGNNLIYGLKDNDGNWFNIRCTDKNILISFAIFETLFNNEILSDVDAIFVNHDGIVARGCSLEDDFWQNNIDLQFYNSKNRPLENVKLIPSPTYKDESIVDIESNPGHSHLILDTWFGSNWMMWFGKGYFQYIPKEVLITFNKCFENKELEDGSVRITLYENLWDYDLPENRRRQWYFREWTGIDEVAHTLMKEPKFSQDPAISIETEESCKYGGVRRIIYYYNPDGNVVAKSKASSRKTFELDNGGTVVWSIEEKV